MSLYTMAAVAFVLLYQSLHAQSPVYIQELTSA